VIKLTGTTRVLNGFNAHLPANQNRVFRQTMVYYYLTDLS